MLHNVQQVAEQLKVSERHVNRLIARGRLAATLVGGDQFRIVDAELSKYVQAGAPDLAMPACDNRGFVSDRVRWERFQADLRAECQNQRLTPLQVEARMKAEPNATRFDVALKATQGVQSVFAKKVDTTFMPPRERAAVASAPDARTAFVLTSLRESAARILSPRGIDPLYANRAAYQRLSAAALTDFLSRPVVYFADNETILGRSVCIIYQLAAELVAPKAMQAQLVDAAF